MIHVQSVGEMSEDEKKFLMDDVEEYYPYVLRTRMFWTGFLDRTLALKLITPNDYGDTIIKGVLKKLKSNIAQPLNSDEVDSILLYAKMPINCDPAGNMFMRTSSIKEVFLLNKNADTIFKFQMEGYHYEYDKSHKYNKYR